MSQIYQHFRDTEKEFIDSAIDWVRRVGDTYTPYLSSFLDPRQQYILKTICGQYEDVHLLLHGGYEKAERKRALIYPNYFDPSLEDFDLQAFEIRYPVKFAELSHGSIMGSILGSGLSRDTLGDIINQGDHWQFVLDANISEFIHMQVDRIGKISVTMIPIDLNDLVQPEDDWQEDTEIVSSLRLDAFIASCLNLARDKAKTLIDTGRVKLNWAEVDKVNLVLEEYDMVSVRGFGRVQFVKEISRTKKDKHLIQVNKKLH